MALTANQLAVALFNAAVGGYKSYVDGKLAKGDAAAAGDLLIDSGLASITDNGTFAYALVEKATGGSLTPAQVQQGADVLVGYMNAGMTRAGTVLEVINFLSNPASVNDATFGSAAQLFQNKVVAADASTSTSTDLTVLHDVVATATNFNLTAALATLKTDTAAVTSFLKALDLNADGQADNAGATQVDDNRAELTVGGKGAYDDALATVDKAVTDVSATLNLGDWLNLTDAQKDAELAKAKVSLAADVTNAKTDADTAYAAMSAALKTAVANYESADTAQKAATVAEGKTDADLAAAIAKYNLDAKVSMTFDPAKADSAAANTTVFDSLITVDGAKFTAALATGVTETTNPGVTAVLNALKADLAAEKALAAADAKLGTTQKALDTADGGLNDKADPAGTDDGIFKLADDAPTYDAYLTLKGLLKTATDKAAALDKAVADLAKVQVQVDALDALDTAAAKAEHAIGAGGYDLNNADGKYDSNEDGNYTDAGDYNFSGGTDAAEKEVYTSAYDTKLGPVTLGAGDLISVAGYTYNAGKVATAGDNTKLEYFLAEKAGNLEVTFETSVFGSNADTQEIVTIVLTGLTMEDGAVSNGYLHLA